MSAWLSRLHEGRMASDLVRPAGKGASDEVADPYGRSRNAYRKCAGELEDLLKRFVALAFPG
jgi:protein-tyrosine-phosphatase